MRLSLLFLAVLLISACCGNSRSTAQNESNTDNTSVNQIDSSIYIKPTNKSSVMELAQKIKQLGKNSIVLDICKRENYKLCGSRFGGLPDVPAGFEWPTYTSQNSYDKGQTYALDFMLQVNCADLAKYDTDHLLPDHGLLLFFYSLDSRATCIEPTQKDAARVYWFEDISTLAPIDEAAVPEDYYKLPMTKIAMSHEMSYPSIQEFLMIEPTTYEEYDTAQAELGTSNEGIFNALRMLGWPDTVQCSMPSDCELLEQGYDLSDYDKIPQQVKEQACKTALDRWVLLLQLNTVEEGEVATFGDDGTLFFFIPKEDLLARRFDRVWMQLQCIY